MFSGNIKIRIIAFFLVMTLGVGCGVPAPVLETTLPTISSTHTPTIQFEPTPTIRIEPTPQPPEHRIGIRVVIGEGEFFDRISGEKFIPRGNNYIRLENQDSPGGEILFHSTYNLGSYDPILSEKALQKMKIDGYNTVRVMLNGCCETNALGNPSGGLRSEYVANLVDFMEKAKKENIFILLEPGDLPVSGGYIEIMDTTWSVDFAGNSASLLRPGGLQAQIKRWQDLIGELIRQGAPLDTILAYELANEVFFESNLEPFSLSSGIVKTANGKSYDMASDSDKQLMMDEGLLFWIDTLRSEILKLDPTALVTVGFFWPQKPNPARFGDPRVIETRAAIWESSADFIDLHPYPGWDLNFQQYVENFGMAGMNLKPIIMGEFGAARSSFPSESAAALALQNWQIESCQYGFDGWLLWTYDTEEQKDFYNGMTGEGLINQVLAPINRPDPCLSGDFDFFDYNLALGMSAESSHSLDNQPPSGVVDGRSSTGWGAGDFAPQWLQINLGKITSIGLIRLIISQSPDGDTLHEVWVGPTFDSLYLLHTFEGYTYDNQVLEFRPDIPVENVQYIRIKTSQSPSWVGWKEIEILAP